jgi:E3 ubiquitin-protein ligase MYCBP2
MQDCVFEHQRISSKVFKKFIVQDDGGPGSDDDERRRPAVLDLQRLVYICRACLRLIVTFTEEVYPGRIAPGSSKPVQETQKLAECVFDVRTLLQQILTDPVPSGIGGSCQKMVRVVLADAHRTYVSCFHAFYPTGYLKWACLCNLVSFQSV